MSWEIPRIGIAEVRDFIRELCDARGKTILISSHILSEISLLADDVGIIDHGTLLTLIWALVPLVNVYQFLTCPIERLVEDGEGLPLRKLLRLPLLWMMLLLMICSGASEATMAQWASAFTESALGVSKTVGDLAGPCLFAAFMGISRILYGKMSEKLNLTKTMLLSGLLCVACYLLAALSPPTGFWTGWVRPLWFQRGHYVAGHYQPFFPKVSERRHRYRAERPRASG